MRTVHAWSALPVTSLALAGCASGLPVWGNLFAFTVTLLIFLGTLGITGGPGRPGPGKKP